MKRLLHKNRSASAYTHVARAGFFCFGFCLFFLGDEGNNPRSGRPTWPMAAPPISKAAHRGALVPSLNDPGSARHSGHGLLLSPRHPHF